MVRGGATSWYVRLEGSLGVETRGVWCGGGGSVVCCEGGGAVSEGGAVREGVGVMLVGVVGVAGAGLYGLLSLVLNNTRFMVSGEFLIIVSTSEQVLLLTSCEFI